MKKIICSDQAPKAVGPYSQGVVVPPFIFLSGMVPINPKAGKIVAVDIEGQTQQVFHNIEELLKAAGAGFEDVVRMEVFLANMDHFQAMNAIYAKYFPGEFKPARHTVQVARLPLDALVEITCTALCKKLP